MIDIASIRDRLIAAADEAGGEVWKVSASNLSDSIYINVRKPRSLVPGWNAATQAWDGAPVVDSWWYALVRVSNHHNHTYTPDRLDADLYCSVMSADEADAAASELSNFLAAAETTLED